MLIGQFRRGRGKQLSRDVERRRCVWRDDQLGRPGRIGGIVLEQGKLRLGRQQFQQPVLDGRFCRLGWLVGHQRGKRGHDSNPTEQHQRHSREDGDHGWGDRGNDGLAIGRQQWHGRQVGDRWALRKRWLRARR
jgi:hypothetical protein